MHLKALAKSLLPREGKAPELPAELEELLEDLDEDEPSSLSRIRELSIEAGLHDHAWHEGVHVCPVTFEVGDVGYISPSQSGARNIADRARFDGFVKLTNVYHHGSKGIPSAHGVDGLDISREVTGSQAQWVNGIRHSCETWPAPMPGDVQWRVRLSVDR